MTKLTIEQAMKLLESIEDIPALVTDIYNYKLTLHYSEGKKRSKLIALEFALRKIKEFQDKEEK